MCSRWVEVSLAGREVTRSHGVFGGTEFEVKSGLGVGGRCMACLLNLRSQCMYEDIRLATRTTTMFSCENTSLPVEESSRKKRSRRPGRGVGTLVGQLATRARQWQVARGAGTLTRGDGMAPESPGTNRPAFPQHTGEPRSAAKSRSPNPPRARNRPPRTPPISTPTEPQHQHYEKRSQPALIYPPRCGSSTGVRICNLSPSGLSPWNES